MRLAAIALGHVVAAMIGCAHGNRTEDEEMQFPTRIVTPPCADAHPPVVLELVRASRDLRPRKPSKDVRHYLVDFHIVRRDSRDLWLLVNEDTFPSAVDSISVDTDALQGPGSTPEKPRERWLFTGNDIVTAWPLGHASESWLENIEVSTGTRRIPVSLGTISVAGMSPREWVRRTGSHQPSNTGEPRVLAVFEPDCTTWFDLAAQAQRQ